MTSDRAVALLRRGRGRRRGAGAARSSRPCGGVQGAAGRGHLRGRAARGGRAAAAPQSRRRGHACLAWAPLRCWRGASRSRLCGGLALRRRATRCWARAPRTRCARRACCCSAGAAQGRPRVVLRPVRAATAAAEALRQRGRAQRRDCHGQAHAAGRVDPQAALRSIAEQRGGAAQLSWDAR